MLVAEIIGNLGNNAEVKNDNGRRYVQFSVAHTVRFTRQDGQTQETTTWVSCFMANADAEVVKYLVSGQRVFVRGNADLRLYSSEKDRKLKAGLSINVREVELVGGSPELVPRELATQDGELLQVRKFYWVDLSSLGEQQPTVLYDRRGNAYTVEQGHWVAPMQTSETQVNDTAGTTTEQQTQQQDPAQSTQANDLPFGEQNQEQQALANYKK